MLLEDYLGEVEEANRTGWLLPVRQVVDQLGGVRRHNYARRDRALLGQVQMARNRREVRWLELAAREARAIERYDREWIRRYIHTRHLPAPCPGDSQASRPQEVLGGRPERQVSAERRPARQDDSSLGASGGMALPPQEGHPPEESRGSRRSSPMVQSPSPSEEEALLREDPSESVTLDDPSAGSGAVDKQRPERSEGRAQSSNVSRRRRRGRKDQSSHSGTSKKPKFEMVTVPRDRGMTVEVPMLNLPRATATVGSSGAQCPIAECSGDGSRRHAFANHLPAIFREELHGEQITTRRVGALSMIASWLLGERATLGSLANYFHLMDLASTLEQRLFQNQVRAMMDICVHQRVDSPARFDLSQAGNDVWILVHWQVLVRLLARVQPPARLQPLMNLFQLTPEEEASLPRPPLAFDSHCHLDRCRTEFGLPRTASLQEICDQIRPDENREVTLEGVVASFCDPVTYPTPEEVHTLTSQGCYVVIGMHPKKTPSEEDWKRLHDLLLLPDVSGLGEIGVDHTVPMTQWTGQTDMIDRGIKEAQNLPKLVVLHCRGVPDQDNTEAYNLLRLALKYQLGQGTLMHLHCFNGTYQVVEKWLESFPNTYFGFTKMVGSLTGERARAVRELHEGRLLIETDAPYFRYGRSRNSSPAVIGMTAAELARVRGCSDWRALLYVTRENAKRLYGRHQRPALD